MGSRSWRIACEAIVAALIGAGLLVTAARSTQPAKWFTAAAALFTLCALVAAYVAARTSWPQYAEWRKAQLAQPKVRVNLEVAPNRRTMADAVSKTTTVRQRSCVLRVVIENDGDASMREATINIVVPTTCEIEPIDPPPKIHYRSVLPTNSDQIEPGEIQTVRWTVARADLTPGHHVFHAEITFALGVGPWPVMVELQGDPTPDEAQRFTRLSVALKGGA